MALSALTAAHDTNIAALPTPAAGPWPLPPQAPTTLRTQAVSRTSRLSCSFQAPVKRCREVQGQEVGHLSPAALLLRPTKQAAAVAGLQGWMAAGSNAVRKR